MKSKLILFVSILLLFLQSRPVLAADDPCQTWGIETFNNCWGGYHVTIDGKLLTGTYTEGTVFTWNFGDGSPTQTTTSNQPAMVGHVYAGSGPYTISLTWQAPSCSPVTVYKTFVPEILKLNFHVSSTAVAPGTPIVLTFGMNDPYYHLNYYLRINSGTNIPVTSPYTFTPTATGAYTLVLIGDERERCTLFDTIVVTVDCPTCATTGISAISPACVGNPSHFINNVGNCSGLGTGATNDLVYTWDYGDGTTAVGFAPDHTYTAAGTYTVKMTYQYVSPDNDGRDCPIKTGGTTTVVVTPCQPPPCEDCIGSFAPTPGDYIIGTWVKQAGGQNLTTYLNAGIKITCHSSFGDVVSGPFFPKSTGKIIDGWQRIEEKITVPLATSQIKIQLLNTGTTDAFFDDIRIHPVDGNMKTYVYDPISLRLMAELDENNYATFYEYDEEGALIRVKKETERGIMTIKENRNNNSKK